MNDQTESPEDAESLEDSRTNAHEGGRSHQPASPVAASPRTGEGHSKKNRAKKSGGEAAPSDPGSDGMVKAKKDKDGRRSGQKKKKSAERKEAKQDERETGTAVTVPSSGDAPPDACASMEEGVKHDTPNPESEGAPHPPTPWPGRLHGQNGGGAGKGLPTNNAGATSKRNSSCGDAEQQQKNEKRQEKETSPEGIRPHGSPTSSDERALDKRRREERRERREQAKAETHVVADQQRRASSELLRGHKEKGRAFWNKERTPRRGILTRSLSVENFSSHQSAEGQRDDAAVYKRKKSKKKKRKALQEEGVKFDKVMVRHYPREVGIGGCMLDPDQGPFLGIGWDWKQEEVHNLYSFERLREADRKHVAHAIPSMARHALLLQYGLGEDDIREMTLEMRRKDKLLRGGSSSILPSFWPWKKAG